MEAIRNFQQALNAQLTENFPHISAFKEIKSEYSAATAGRAIIDLTGMNVIYISGKDCADLLHRMTMNEMRKMQDGDVIVNALTNAKGKLVDAFFQLKRDDGYLLITSRGQGKCVIEWLDRYIFVENVNCKDVTDSYGLFLLTGRGAMEIFTGPIAEFKQTSYSSGDYEAKVVPVKDFLPRGILMIAPIDNVFPIYKNLVEKQNCTPAGAQAFHIIRVEQGVPIFGNEFTSEEVNPYEAGLKNHISYTKGCFIGQEVIARLDTYDKVKYEYARLQIECPAFESLPLTILADNTEAGIVTSSAPDMKNENKSLAIGRIRRKFLQQHRDFHVVVTGNRVNLRVLSSTIEG